MRTPPKAHTQRQATMRLPRLPRESKPQTKKRAVDSAEVGEQAHDRKTQHDCACSPCPREEFRRQKPTTGSKARRIQRLEQREHRKRPTTRATQKQVRHDERIEYAHALPFSTRQRHDAPVRCHIVAIRCVKYSRSAASETMSKKAPNARRVRDAFRTSARQPQKSRPFRVGFSLAIHAV